MDFKTIFIYISVAVEVGDSLQSTPGLQEIEKGKYSLVRMFQVC